MLKKVVKVLSFLITLLVLMMPSTIFAVSNYDATVNANKSYTIYQNVTTNGVTKTLNRVVRTYSFGNNYTAYKINAELLGPGEEKGPNNYRVSATNPDLKQIGIVQYGKKKGYSDLAIQIALNLEAVFSGKSNDEMFKNAYELYVEGVTDQKLTAYDYGKGEAQYGTGDRQLYSNDGIKNDIVNAFEIYFYSSTVTLELISSSKTSETFNCVDKVCYYPGKENYKTISEITNLKIPTSATILDVALGNNSAGKLEGNYKNKAASNATIKVTVASAGTCENCAYEEITITYEDSGVVTIPKMAYPKSGAGVSITTSSNMIVYENSHIANTKFNISSGEGVDGTSGGLSSKKGLNFTQFKVCGIEIVVEGGTSKRGTNYYGLKTLAENLDDPKNNPDLVTDYTQIFGKKACTGEDYLLHGDDSNGASNLGSYNVSGENNLANNRYCRIYCKEDLQINTPQTIKPKHSYTEAIFTGRFFTLQDLVIETKKTCVAVKTDPLGNPTNEPGINLSQFYLDVYGYSWIEGSPIPSADTLNAYRTSPSGSGSSGGSGGSGGGSGYNSKYATNACAQAALKAILQQAKNSSKDFDRSVSKRECTGGYEEIKYSCNCGGCCKSYLGQKICTCDCSTCSYFVCKEFSTLVYGAKGKTYEGGITMDEIRTAIKESGVSASLEGSCSSQVINALNLTEQDLNSMDSGKSVGFSVDVVESEYGNVSYDEMMSWATNSQTSAPLTETVSDKNYSNFYNPDNDLAIQSKIIFSEYSDHQIEVYEEVYKKQFDESMSKMLQEHPIDKSNLKSQAIYDQMVSQANTEAETRAKAEAVKAGGQSTGIPIAVGSQVIMVSNDYNWMQELYDPNKYQTKVLGSLESSLSIAQSRTYKYFNNIQEGISDLIECSTFFKNINYDYDKPEIKFKYCDEYEIEYELTGKVSDEIKVEFCRSTPNVENYTCPEDDKVILKFNKNDIAGMSSSQILNYMKGVKSETSVEFNDLIQNIKHYDCGENKCSAETVAYALISTNLGSKVEYTAKWTANTVTKYYATLPNGVARKENVDGRSILLNGDGLVYPINIKNGQEVCEYSFEFKNLGERGFEDCYGNELAKAAVCNFDIPNEIVSPKTNGINYFYRPISLDDVFKNEERTKGSNWTTRKGEKTMKEIEANGDSIYENTTGDPDKGLQYSYTITPTQAYRVRSYNNDREEWGGYADFDLTCTETGIKCVSSFLSGKMLGCEGTKCFTDNLSVDPNVRDTDTFCSWYTEIDGEKVEISWKGKTPGSVCRSYDEEW